MEAVIRAVAARQAVDRGDCVSTAQLALLTGISHIQVGNYVRDKRLFPDSHDTNGYLFAASAARDFLVEREVEGYAAKRRRRRAC